MGRKNYLWLFGINLFISSFTFGGGYVVVPMFRKYFVRKRRLFGEEELMEMAAVAQSAPGAIAINLSALAGHRVGGVLGVVISGIAAILPPLLLLTVISHWYSVFISNLLLAAVLRGMQAGVAAVIVDYIIDMVRMITKQRSALLTALIPIVFAANFIFHVHVAILLVGCCLFCILKLFLSERRKQKR